MSPFVQWPSQLNVEEACQLTNKLEVINTVLRLHYENSESYKSMVIPFPPWSSFLAALSRERLNFCHPSMGLPLNISDVG